MDLMGLGHTQSIESKYLLEDSMIQNRKYMIHCKELRSNPFEVKGNYVKQLVKRFFANFKCTFKQGSKHYLHNNMD